MDKFDHIRKNEERLDKHNDILKSLNKLLDEFEESQEEFNKLKEYYASEKFQEDFDKSNRGDLPKDLKSGVLSEDAVYNTIGDNFNTAIRMLEIATRIIKTH